MSSNDKAETAKEGPNYPKIVGMAAVAGAVGAGVGVVAHLGTAVAGVVGAGGFLAVLAGLLSKHAIEDGKKGIAHAQVKRKTEEAWTSQALGRNDKAEKFLLEALAASAPLGEDHVSTLATNHSLANLYRLWKKYDQAEKYFDKAAGTYDKLGLRDQNAALCYRDRGQCLYALGKHKEALDSVNKAIAILGAKEDRELIKALSLQANIYVGLGQKDEAIPVFVKVKGLNEKLLGPESRDALRTSLTIARCYRDLKRSEESLEAFKELLGRVNKADPPQKAIEAEALLEMAELCLDMGQFKNVEPLVITSLKVLQNHLGPNDTLLQRLLKAYREGREKLNLGVKENDFLHLFTLDREKIRSTFAEHTDYIALKDKSGWGPLQWCCFLGRDDLLKWLLRNGAKVADYDAATVLGPIHVAAAWSKMSQVNAILEAGAPVDSAGPQGVTPLLLAATLGKTETVEQLLVRGANIATKDSRGRSALHLAAEGGHTEIIASLLGRGTDRNLREDRLGQTALHLAAFMGHGPVVECLLNNQADLTIQDKNGKTAAQLAAQGGHDLLVKAIEFQEKMARGDNP